VALRDLGKLPVREGDLFVVEQALKNLETYPLLLRRRKLGYGVGMWGHGRTFSTRQSQFLAYGKTLLTRQAEWFFSYTERGARHVCANKFPQRQVTVVNNTVDTARLLEDIRHLSPSSIEHMRRSLGLTKGRTALFIGGVDQAKGIEFLLEAAKMTSARLPGFMLLVGGTGSSMDVVREAESRGESVRSLGRITGRRKALALSVADILAIPKQIGLVAVDSLASGRPIVSTKDSSHGPECDYVTSGETAVFTQDNTEAYCRAMVNLLQDGTTLQKMQVRCTQVAHQYTLHEMVNRFSSGVLEWIEHRNFRGLP